MIGKSRFVLFSGVLTVFLIMEMPSFAQNKSVYPDFGMGVVFGVNFDQLPNIAGTVSNVPAKLRSLPSHPNDTWIYGRRQALLTVPFSTINPNPVNSATSFFVGPEATYKRFRVRGGINFTSIGDVGQGLTKSNEGATREINQRGFPYRGSGTSLVYYNMYPKSSRVPGAFFETSINVSRYVSMMTGTSLKSFNLMVETGYDRFNRLEKYETNHADRVDLKDVYIGAEFELPISYEGTLSIVGMQILAGKMYDDPVSINGMVISTLRPWYLKMGFDIHISTR